MKTKKKLLAGVLCILMLIICVVGLSSCGGCKHEYGEWTVKSEADCTKLGYRERTCAKCGEVETEPVAALGHDFTAETVNSETLKTAADCLNAAVYYKSCARCGELSADTFTSGDALGHSFTAETVKDEAFILPAKCTSAALYHKSCAKCGEVSAADTDTFTFGDPLPHTYDQEIVKSDALKSDPDCTSAAVYYRSCACGEVSTSDSEVFTTGGVSHKYDQETVKPEALKSAADCTNAAVYYKSCRCGLVSTSEYDVFTDGTALGHKDEDHDHICDNGCGKNDMGVCSDSDTDSDHVCDYGCGKSLNNCVDNDKNHKCDVCGETVSEHDYQIDESKTAKATCTAAKKITKVCSICRDEKTYTEGDALGHKKDESAKVTERKSGTCECEYTRVYTCSECNKTYDGETVYKHTYTAKITTPATCKADGVKTFTCSKCDENTDGHTKTETITKSDDYHSWTAGTADASGVRTDTCSYCEATKTVREYEGGTTGSIESSALSDKLKIGDIGIDMDAAAAGGITGNVTVSAGELSDEDRKSALDSVDPKKQEQIGDNPIYNFGVEDGNGTVSNFNGDVTVTLPYTLGANEDVDSIAVWYINASGELKSIKATYNVDSDGKGYVTFKTNHFSYYTVTRLTPEERCTIYGHIYNTHEVTQTCTQDGYTLKICIRCGNTVTEGFQKATGHSYDKVTVPATCTENGSETYTCNNKGCTHYYTVTLYATGHSYTETDSKEATCTENGYTKYKCDCDDEYTVYTAKAQHDYDIDTSHSATCEAGGYTHYKCNNCDYEYKTDLVPALGHSFVISESGWTWSDDKSSVTLKLVCEREGCTHEGVTLTASVAVSVISGKEFCSDFVKTTYTATAVYNGVYFTDTKTETVGTPSHTFTNVWVKDGNKHWHECVCGEKTDICEHTYGNAVVTKDPTCVDKGESTAYCVCGATKVSEVKETGKHTYSKGECTVCHKPLDETYYYTLINSWRKVDGFAFKIKSFTYSAKELNDDGETYTLNGSMTFDFTELVLSFKDGKLSGTGIGKLTMYNTNGYGETDVYSFRAEVKDGWIYIYVDQNGDVMVAKVSLDAVIEYALEGATEASPDAALYIGQISEIAEPVIKFVSDAVVPTVEALKFANSDKINGFFKDLFNILFVFEEQENGTYVATLDYDKLLALNENLATKPVSELIDTYFGEGAFDDITAAAVKALGLKVGSVPDYCTLFGIDYESFIDSINDLMEAFGMEGFDLDALINDAYKDLTIGAAFGIEDSEAYEDFIKMYTEPLKSVSTYDLVIGIISSIGGSEGGDDSDDVVVDGAISGEGSSEGANSSEGDSFDISEAIPSGVNTLDEDGDDGADGSDDGSDAGAEFAPSEMAQTLKEMIKSVIGIIKENNVKISFTTTGEGELTAVKLAAKTKDGGYEYETQDGVYYKLDLILDISLELNGKLDTKAEDIGDIAGDVDKNIVLPGESIRKENEYDCWNETNNYGGIVEWGDKSYSYTGSKFILEIPDYSKLLQISAMPDCTGWTQYNAVYALKRIEFVATTITVEGKTVNLIIDLETGNAVEWKKDDTQYKVILADTEKNVGITTLGDLKNSDHAMLYISAFGTEGGKLSYDGYDVEYYYNATTKEYATESQHTEGEWEYSLENKDTDCSDGVNGVLKCKTCKAILSESRWQGSHPLLVTEKIDLESNTCGGEAVLKKCVCGKYQGVDISGLECDFPKDEDEKEEIKGDEISVWIENALKGYSYDTGGGYTFDAPGNSVAYMYTCSVTDPACGYKIRYARYWLRDNANECIAYEYETWEFGYKESVEGDYTAEKTVTYKTGNVRTAHINWVDGVYSERDANNVSTCLDQCTKCGSYWKQKVTYVDSESGNKLKEESEAKSTVSVSRYTKYEHWVKYDGKGDAYNNQTESYTKLTRADGRYSEEHSKTEAYTETDKFPCEYTSGEKYTYSYTYEDGYKTETETVTVRYKGYGYTLYRYTYYNGGARWEKHDYRYSFDAENGCTKTDEFTTSYGENSTSTYDICHSLTEQTVKAPTCTQDGEKCDVCAVCGKKRNSVTVQAADHAWVQLTDGWYRCFKCGLENANGVSGNIVMEDMTGTDEEYYIVGYYIQDGGDINSYSQNVSLVFADGRDPVTIPDINITAVNGKRAFTFLKSDVTAYADANGYTDYEVRFAFVPMGGSSSFDYAITFAEPTAVENKITDNVSFTAYVDLAEKVKKEYIVTPTVDGTWVFMSFENDGDGTEAELYDSKGNEVGEKTYNGNNFKITYDLKAGETYTVTVWWTSPSKAGNMNLFFGYNKTPAVEDSTESNGGGKIEFPSIPDSDISYYDI